jgi:WD40 repeat protein
MAACACLALGLGLAIAAGPPPRITDDASKRNRIANLIEQLGDDSFARREAASKALEAIGKPAIRPLRKAADSSTDLEIRWRANRVIEALALKIPGLVQKDEEVHRIGWANVHVFNTTFSPDSRFVLAGGDGSTLRLYEVKTGKLIRELVGHTGYAQQAVFTPDGKQVLSASSDRTLRLWDLDTGKERRRFEGHTEEVVAVDLTRDGKWALSGGADRTLRLWEVGTGKEVRKFEDDTKPYMGLFTRDGKQVLSCGSNYRLRLWDIASGKGLHTFEGHRAYVYGAFVLPDGKRALSYSADLTARVWDLATGKEVRKLDLGPNLSDIRGLALSPDGNRMVVGRDHPGVVRLLDLVTGKEIHRFELTGNPRRRFRIIANPRGLSFSPDGRLAASGSHRGFVYVWRMPGIFDLD